MAASTSTNLFREAPFCDSSSELKLDPGLTDPTFYTPTSAPYSQTGLQALQLQQVQQQQALQQSQQQQLLQSQQQDYYSNPANGFTTLADGFLSHPSTPPLLEHDNGMSNYTFGMASSYPSNGYENYYEEQPMYSQSIPRSMNNFDMSAMNLRNFEFSPSPAAQSCHPSPHGLLIDNSPAMYGYGRSRSPPSPRDSRLFKNEDEVEGLGEEEAEEKTEEPYAKLIHRALMQAPGHSMALQEIYRWFEENTEKASSTGSGWRNSIRHNLSMNLAFRKTDRNPTSPSDGPPKKTSEWVLEDWAVKDGVTPTTRYRKKTSSKTHRDAANINTSRQNAGKKGGNAAGRSRQLRMQTRGVHAPSPRDSSTPRDIDREYEESRKRQRITTGGENSNITNNTAAYRCTPPNDEPSTPTFGLGHGQHSQSPYFYAGSNASYEALAMPEQLDNPYSWSQVQGVDPRAEVPLFSGEGFGGRKEVKVGVGSGFGGWEFAGY